MDETSKEHIQRVCRDVLAPLIAIDGGSMHIVRFDGDDVHIHLGGMCAGCPGASVTREKVILTALRAAVPKVQVVLTTGVRVPEGARRVGG